MAENGVISQPQAVEVGRLIDPTPPDAKPAPGADDPKPKTDADKTADSEVAGSDAEKVEADPALSPEQQEAKKQSKFQRRLDRQKSARVEAETEARLLRERLAKLETERAKPAEDAKAGDPNEPQRDKFDDYEAYLLARAEYRATQTTAKAIEADRAERAKAEGTRKAATEQEALAKNWSEREQEFQKATKDYIEVVSPFIEDGLDSLAEPARRAIAESEVGPQLLYHLSQNDEVAQALGEMSPLQQVKELGRLETKFEKSAPAAPAPKGKLASDAPAPVSREKGSTSTAHGLAENASQAQYEATRKSQGARWAR